MTLLHSRSFECAVVLVGVFCVVLVIAVGNSVDPAVGEFAAELVVLAAVVLAALRVDRPRIVAKLKHGQWPHGVSVQPTLTACGRTAR